MVFAENVRRGFINDIRALVDSGNFGIDDARFRRIRNVTCERGTCRLRSENAYKRNNEKKSECESVRNLSSIKLKSLKVLSHSRLRQYSDSMICLYLNQVMLDAAVKSISCFAG